MSFDPSSALIGWFAVLVAVLGFGSYAVPIKGEAASSVNIDPLVMQSYKSLICFLTSWLVVLFDQEVTFTWWGVVSGLFWVPGGTFYVFGVKNCGIATTQGIVSSSIVTVSFIWGHFVFHEPVKSQIAAYAAVLVIMIGLVGMSLFSSTTNPLLVANTDVGATAEYSSPPARRQYTEKEEEEDYGCLNDETPHVGVIPISQQLSNARRRVVSDDMTPLRKYSRRSLGQLSALMCGVWGGSCMVPMHYSNGNTHGLGYVISFATGALVVTNMLWILRFGYLVFTMRSALAAYNSLPSFHLRVMCLPGATAGALWSIGNVGSIIACQRLGQSVGYSATQAALFVSGIWGIFYYNEVTKSSVIVKWFLSAMVTVSGILLLGYVSTPAVQGPDR